MVNTEYWILCVYLCLYISGVKIRLVNDWLTGWQVSEAAAHRFITGLQWWSGALQGTVDGGNASGLLINILSPPFSYSQAWHHSWPGPPQGKMVFLNNKSATGREKQKKPMVCLVSEKMKKSWHQLTFMWIWYAVCNEVECMLVDCLRHRMLNHNPAYLYISITVKNKINKKQPFRHGIWFWFLI